MNYILSLVYLLFINIINENRGCARTPILPLSEVAKIGQTAAHKLPTETPEHFQQSHS